MAEQFIEQILSVGQERPASQIFYCRVPVAGNLIRVDVWVGSPSGVGVETIFDVNKNGATVFGSPTDRPTIDNSSVTDAATGLAVAVIVGDILTVDLDQVPIANVAGPITVRFVIDDGVTGDATSLQGNDVSADPPSNGDVLVWNDGDSEWEPQAPPSGAPTGSAGGDLSGTYPNPGVAKLGGSSLPSNSANGFLKRNAANNAWEEVAYGSGSNSVCQGNDSRLSDSRAPTGSAGGDLSGTYPNPAVAKVQGLAVKSGASPSDGDTLIWSAAHSQFEPGAAGGGGSNGYTIYDPTLPPTSPHAKNDEFAGTSLDGKWSQYNGSDITITVAADLLQLFMAHQSGIKVSGIYQTLPTGDWTLQARMSVAKEKVGTVKMGIALFVDATSNSNGLDTFGIQTLSTGDTYLGSSRNYTNRTTDGGANFNGAIENPGLWSFAYFKLIKSGTSYDCYTSRDGVRWIVVGTLSGTYAHFGFVIDYPGATGTQTLYVDFVRIFTTDPLIVGGQRTVN